MVFAAYALSAHPATFKSTEPCMWLLARSEWR